MTDLINKLNGDSLLLKDAKKSCEESQPYIALTSPDIIILEYKCMIMITFDVVQGDTTAIIVLVHLLQRCLSGVSFMWDDKVVFFGRQSGSSEGNPIAE